MEKQNPKWMTAHCNAMISPRGDEIAIVNILKLLHELKDRGMAHDYIFCDHFASMLVAGRELLNFGTGRLDAGLCDRKFCDIAIAIGYDLALGEWVNQR